MQTSLVSVRIGHSKPFLLLQSLKEDKLVEGKQHKLTLDHRVVLTVFGFNEENLDFW